MIFRDKHNGTLLNVRRDDFINDRKYFQEIREKKNQTIANTSDGIVTPQFLRKYERENGDIRFSNLVQLLNRLNTTIDEFVFEIDEGKERSIL